jgi:hypothetical protein
VDFTKLTEMFQGNGMLFLLAVLFLFKDEIFARFRKPAPAPVPLPVPLPSPAPAPDVVIDRPVIDLITKLLPVVLPIITQLLEKGIAKGDEEKSA